MTQSGKLRFGIGGWTFEPWRGVFYPEGLRQADELAYAASKLTAIEINGTYYSSFKPDSWAKWREATPAGFKFAVKASRFCTNRKVLAQGGESVGKFLNQGLSELGDRLGPILWQFAPTKTFDETDFEGFLQLLPDQQNGLPLTHVLEVRHPSFSVPAFIALARKHAATVCVADHFTYPMIADVTGDVVYARLQTGSDDEPTAYKPKDLDAWVGRLKAYSDGGAPSDLAMADAAHPAPVKPRDVYAFVIHEGKVRAPAAAMALIEKTAA
jgi:uncharacterized protein YecE (DUF72 family)